MKKYLSILLVFCLLLTCFIGCNSTEKDPKDTAEQPTESQSESESVSESESDSESESVSESETEGTLEKVFLKEEEIPGTPLDFSAIFSQQRFDISELRNDSFMIFETKAECDQVLGSLNPDDALLQAIGEVDFENYSLLAIEISVASSETIASIPPLQTVWRGICCPMR